MPIVGIITFSPMESVLSTSARSPYFTSPTLPAGGDGEANGVKTDSVSPGDRASLQMGSTLGSVGSLDTTTPQGGTLSVLGRAS